jgi:hypothetical protein
VSDKSNRGFAAMDPDKQREIAAEAGRAAHEKGSAHELSSQEEWEAGPRVARRSAGTASTWPRSAARVGRAEAVTNGATRGANFRRDQPQAAMAALVPPDSIAG